KLKGVRLPPLDEPEPAGLDGVGVTLRIHDYVVGPRATVRGEEGHAYLAHICLLDLVEHSDERGGLDRRDLPVVARKLHHLIDETAALEVPDLVLLLFHGEKPPSSATGSFGCSRPVRRPRREGREGSRL